MDRQDFHSHCSHVWARRAHVRGSRFLLGLSTSCTSLGPHRSTPLHTGSLPAKPCGSGVGMGRCWVANQVSYSTGEGKRGQARSRVNARQAELLLRAELASWQSRHFSGEGHLHELLALRCAPQGCRALLNGEDEDVSTSFWVPGRNLAVWVTEKVSHKLFSASPYSPLEMPTTCDVLSNPLLCICTTLQCLSYGLCPWSRSPR